MKKVSVSIRQEQYDALVEREESGDAGSISEALRQVLDEYEEVRSEYESERARADDLRRQLSEANKRNDEVTELVEYVEAEKSLRDRREERLSAPAWRRAKWWLLGRDD